MEGRPYHLATSRAVPGMSWMRPHAPAEDLARWSNELSSRITAVITDGRGERSRVRDTTKSE